VLIVMTVVVSIVLMMINKISVKFANQYNARIVGMAVYYPSYWVLCKNGILKLILESFFDMVICSMINLSAFIRNKGEFKDFFMTGDNIFCSMVTLVHAFLLIFFLAYSCFLIRSWNIDKQQEIEGLLSILMDGVNPHSYHSSMYIVYFMIRRLLTGIGLVVFVKYPIFQCLCLLLFSTINLCYLLTVMPLKDTKSNLIEIFNELTIMFCAHLFNIFLRKEGTVDFINWIGWSFIIAASLNITINLAIVLFEQLFGLIKKAQMLYRNRKLMKVVKDRERNREIITSEAPGHMLIFER
jgi:hypothetical protein